MSISYSNDFTSTTLQNYHSLKNENKWEEAKQELEYASNCSCLPAKVELARFLRNTPALNMSQAERYAKAEALYLEIIEQFNLPNNVTARIAHELAVFYSSLKRPIACLAFLLMAKRYGFNVSDGELDICNKQLHEVDINTPGNAHDAYVLGIELYLDGTFNQMTEFFLRVAAESTDAGIRGMAYLTLADFYDSQSRDNPSYIDDALRCYKLAKKNGYPEYISPSQEENN